DLYLFLMWRTSIRKMELEDALQEARKELDALEENTLREKMQLKNTQAELEKVTEDKINLEAQLERALEEKSILQDQIKQLEQKHSHEQSLSELSGSVLFLALFFHNIMQWDGIFMTLV
ncbi:hypothetical protein ACJX0J_034019, partial [Zea mays]